MKLLGQYEVDGEKQQIDDPYMASLYLSLAFPMTLVQRRGRGDRLPIHLSCLSVAKKLNPFVT